jgi:hypothetical protein
MAESLNRDHDEFDDRDLTPDERRVIVWVYKNEPEVCIAENLVESLQLERTSIKWGQTRFSTGLPLSSRLQGGFLHRR